MRCVRGSLAALDTGTETPHHPEMQPDRTGARVGVGGRLLVRSHSREARLFPEQAVRRGSGEGQASTAVSTQPKELTANADQLAGMRRGRGTRTPCAA